MYKSDLRIPMSNIIRWIKDNIFVNSWFGRFILWMIFLRFPPKNLVFISEEIAFTARPKIHSHSQIFRYGRSIFCLPHRPKFSDVFDLCLHWVPVVRGQVICLEWTLSRLIWSSPLCIHFNLIRYKVHRVYRLTLFINSFHHEIEFVHLFTIFSNISFSGKIYETIQIDPI